MTYPRFFSYLAVFTLVAIFAAAASHYLLAIDYALPLTVGTIFLFILFCVGLFWISSRTAGADNKFLFTNVFMVATMLKLFLCGGIIAAYAILAEPENKLFVVPFFLSYLIYTTLEIVFLVKLAGITDGVNKA